MQKLQHSLGFQIKFWMTLSEGHIQKRRLMTLTRTQGPRTLRRIQERTLRRTLSLKTLKRTLSLKTLKKTQRGYPIPEAHKEDSITDDTNKNHSEDLSFGTLNRTLSTKDLGGDVEKDLLN